MSDIAIGRSDEGPFRAATVALVLIVGILSFLGLLILGAYAPDFRSGDNGGSHAMSNAATGFSGIVRLAAATGRNPEIVRTGTALRTPNLLVVTPDRATDDLSPVLMPRAELPTLVIIPKWDTVPDKRSGWVRSKGIKQVWESERILAPGVEIDVRIKRAHGLSLKPVGSLVDDLQFKAPDLLQTMSGEELHPMMTAPDGSVVLARVGNQQIYLLSDPDLLSNMGMSDLDQANAALKLLDSLNRDNADGIAFDVTLNGLGHSRSPLRLAFDPPFIAATIALALCLLLAGIQALYRFGSPRPPQRAIAFGKAALIENSAALIRKARREARFVQRYPDVIRQRAMSLFRVPARLKDGEIDAYLDGLSTSAPFSALAERTRTAQDEVELLEAARALNLWLKENAR